MASRVGCWQSTSWEFLLKIKWLMWPQDLGSELFEAANIRGVRSNPVFLRSQWLSVYLLPLRFQCYPSAEANQQGRRSLGDDYSPPLLLHNFYFICSDSTNSLRSIVLASSRPQVWRNACRASFSYWLWRYPGPKWMGWRRRAINSKCW